MQIADALDAAHAQGHRPPRHQAGEHLRDRRAARRRCSTSVSPSSAARQARDSTATDRCDDARRGPDRARHRRSGRWRTCRRSRRAARSSTRAPICFRSASCSTRWRPASSRSPDARRRSSSTRILHKAPTAPVRLNPNCPASWSASSTRRSRRIATLRYQSAADLRADLKRLKRDVDSSRAVAVEATPAPPAKRRAKWTLHSRRVRRERKRREGGAQVGCGRRANAALSVAASLDDLGLPQRPSRSPRSRLCTSRLAGGRRASAWVPPA